MPDGSVRAIVARAVLAEQDRRKRLVEMKEAAEQDLVAFVRMFWPVLEPEKPLVEGWLLDMLCDVLMAVTDGHLRRVCINVPPGSTKSTLLNVLWPAFEWGPQNKPGLRYISISYSTGVPIRDNLRFAALIRHPVYKKCWGDRVNITRDGAEWVQNDKTGWKMVSSTGGGVTGFRGDRLLLDDLNNPGSVESDVVRETTSRFVREIMPSRVNDLELSAIINLQQRTHQEDATGTLIKQQQEQMDAGALRPYQRYTFVCVPMEFDPLRIGSFVLRRDVDGEPEDVWTDPRALDQNGDMLPGLTTNERGEPAVRMGSPMAKAEGETCWPERFPQETLPALKIGMAPYAWDSQFNQIPGIRGGAVIRRDWWKLWAGEYPELGTVVVSLDTAVEENTQSDYNACTVWGAFAGPDGEPLLLLLEAWRERMPLAQLVEKVAVTCRSRRADYLLIEHRTRGRDVHDEIVRLYQNARWQTELVKVEASKLARLKAVEHLFSGDYREDAVSGIGVWGPVKRDPKTGKDVGTGGIIYAPDRSWVEEVIDEVASFPYSAHDDYVDSVSQALGFVRKNGVVLRRVEYDEQELERNRFKRPQGVPYTIKAR